MPGCIRSSSGWRSGSGWIAAVIAIAGQPGTVFVSAVLFWGAGPLSCAFQGNEVVVTCSNLLGGVNCGCCVMDVG